VSKRANMANRANRANRMKAIPFSESLYLSLAKHDSLSRISLGTSSFCAIMKGASTVLLDQRDDPAADATQPTNLLYCVRSEKGRRMINTALMLILAAPNTTPRDYCDN
jgi:hypothetical protein